MNSGEPSLSPFVGGIPCRDTARCVCDHQGQQHQDEMRDRCLGMPMLVSGVKHNNSKEGAAHFLEPFPMSLGEPGVCSLLGFLVGDFLVNPPPSEYGNQRKANRNCEIDPEIARERQEVLGML